MLPGVRLALALAFLVLAASAFATPEFARAYREYKITCYSCHTQPPKLTKFGEDFVKNGYSIPGKPRMDTTPLAVWVSGQLANSNTQPGTYRTVPNRFEIISGGRSGGTSYFIEWRVLSKELLNDGSYRDRSGRFEDLFVIFGVDDSIQFQVGQFRAMSQIDVSRRLFLSEPAAFSTAMPGEADPDPRIQSLRGFSLSGRAPSARVTLAQGEWTASVTVPFPGEISVPLTKEARDTASFEFEGSPKGAFVEFYRREDQDSVGLHAFFGDNDRTLVGAAAQRRFGDLWFEGGVSRAEFAGSHEWRYSVSADWIPRHETAAGLRLDHRQIAGQTVSLTPYISLFERYGTQAAKLTLEGRFQDGRTPRFAIELAWFF